MKPKLLITTSTLPNDERDPEPRFVVDLAIGLSRHFEVCILAPRCPGAEATAAFADVEVRRYPYAPPEWETLSHPGATLERLRQKPMRWGLVPLLMNGLHRETRRLTAERNFACVHTHWLVPQAMVHSLIPAKSRAPYIAIAHGADVHAVNGVLGSAMLRTAMRRASGVVGASQSLLATLLQRFPSEMDARPATVIGMGVDTEKFSPTLRSDFWAAVHGIPGPVILYVGRLAEKKGIEIALAAMASPPLASVPATLVIVGGGPSEQRLKELGRKLRLGDRIRFLPPVGHADLGRHIASADILCVPSIVTASGDQEGRPTVLVEAAACGVPVVASDVGGVRDWVEDGANGVLVPPADPSALSKAIAGLVTRPELMRHMGNAARKKALETTWSAVADRYAEFTLRAIRQTREQR